MVDSPPIQYRFGKKTLYVQALTMETEDIFLHEFATFLKTFKARLDGIKFYELDELQGLEDKTEIILKALDLFRAQDARNGFISIVSRTLLKDPNCNPDKIKAREITKRLTPNQLAQIFYAVYAYNIGVEKKNFQAMLEIIGLASSGADAMRFSESMKSTDTARKKTLKPLFPDSPFFPEHLRKSKGTTKSSEKSTKKESEA